MVLGRARGARTASSTEFDVWPESVSCRLRMNQSLQWQALRRRNEDASHVFPVGTKSEVTMSKEKWRR